MAEVQSEYQMLIKFKEAKDKFLPKRADYRSQKNLMRQRVSSLNTCENKTKRLPPTITG